MGDFDDQIAWCKERRAIAAEELRDFEAGQRWYRNDVDITPQLMDRAKRDIAQFDILIAAYESHNEPKP